MIHKGISFKYSKLILFKNNFLNSYIQYRIVCNGMLQPFLSSIINNFLIVVENALPRDNIFEVNLLSHYSLDIVIP